MFTWMWIHCTLRSPRSLTLRPWQNLSSLTHPRIVQPPPSHAYKYRSQPVVSHSFVTNPLVSPDHLFPHSSAARCLTLSTPSPTPWCQGYSEQLTTSGSCGQASTKMIGIGHAPAFSANEKRHTNTPLPPPAIFLLLMLGSHSWTTFAMHRVHLPTQMCGSFHSLA